jgi:hypothetical protein
MSTKRVNWGELPGDPIVKQMSCLSNALPVHMMAIQHTRTSPKGHLWRLHWLRMRHVHFKCAVTDAAFQMKHLSPAPPTQLSRLTYSAAWKCPDAPAIYLCATLKPSTS